MAIEGSIRVDVGFTDSVSSANVESVKRISLVDTTNYTTGKVAIVTGTVGTSAVQIDVGPSVSAYKDSGGSTVGFATVQRFAFSASGSPATCSDSNGQQVRSAGGRACVSDAFAADDPFEIQTTSGTASYTLVIYGT